MQSVNGVVGFDGYHLFGVDPITGLRCVTFAKHGLEVPTARLMLNETVERDVNRYADLVRRPGHAGVLALRAAPEPHSPRLHEILRPLGYRSELRLVLVDGGRYWGGLSLFRDERRHSFTDADAEVAADLSEVVGAALRRHQRRRPGVEPDARPAGAVLVGSDGQLLSVSPEAEVWLSQLTTGGRVNLDDASRVVYEVAHAAASGRGDPVCRVRTSEGRWLVISGARTPVPPVDVTVVIQPADLHQILPAFGAWCGLSRRENQVLGLAQAVSRSGRSTPPAGNWRPRTGSRRSRRRRRRIGDRSYDQNVRQTVGYCAAPDAVKLAYAVHGDGPPIVRVATWMTHLEFDWESPVWRHWLDALGDGHTLVRYDERGCGLSDRDVDDISFDAWVADLETVVDAAGLDRFALLGVSAGAAVAVAYAARHPERVTHLVLYGGYARGRTLRGASERKLQEALVAAIAAGWTNPDPTFRHLFSMLFLPQATAEQMGWYDDLQRHSTSAATAVRLYHARGRLNVVELAARVRARTLVLHALGDRVVPVDEGRLLATLLPDARLVALESANHILMSDEPAWASFVSELRAFLGTERATARPGVGVEELSPRELDVLELVAAGLTNEEIAERLSLSVRTVERHLTNTYVKLGVSGKAGRAAAAARFSRRP